MSQPAHATAIEAVLRRDRAIIASGLVLIAALAWVWVLVGAGTGMNVLMMSRLAIFPGGEAGMITEAAPWSLVHWLVIVSMWWIMMIAMMIPSAAPMILLHARVTRHAQMKGQMTASNVPFGSFVAGYLLVWLGFSIVASALQFITEHMMLLSQPMMWTVNVWLAAGLLIITGLYQVSPIKRTCLRNCRSPAEFLARHWYPGRAGAFRTGLEHGAFCLGCCWSLMLLLFVGGIMNIFWIVGLSMIVLLEKLLPGGDRLSWFVGPLLIGGGLMLLAAKA